MECIRCHSSRLIRFLDGFGERRVFCRTCHESTLLNEMYMQRSILDIAVSGGMVS